MCQFLIPLSNKDTLISSCSQLGFSLGEGFHGVEMVAQIPLMRKIQVSETCVCICQSAFSTSRPFSTVNVQIGDMNLMPRKHPNVKVWPPVHPNIKVQSPIIKVRPSSIKGSASPNLIFISLLSWLRSREHNGKAFRSEAVPVTPERGPNGGYWRQTVWWYLCQLPCICKCALNIHLFWKRDDHWVKHCCYTVLYDFDCLTISRAYPTHFPDDNDITDRVFPRVSLHQRTLWCFL